MHFDTPCHNHMICCTFTLGLKAYTGKFLILVFNAYTKLVLNDHILFVWCNGFQKDRAFLLTHHAEEQSLQTESGVGCLDLVFSSSGQ